MLKIEVGPTTTEGKTVAVAPPQGLRVHAAQARRQRQGHGADAVQRAEGGDALEQGPVHLGEHRLLLVRARVDHGLRRAAVGPTGWRSARCERRTRGAGAAGCSIGSLQEYWVLAGILQEPNAIGVPKRKRLLCQTADSVQIRLQDAVFSRFCADSAAETYRSRRYLGPSQRRKITPPLRLCKNGTLTSVPRTQSSKT